MRTFFFSTAYDPYERSGKITILHLCRYALLQEHCLHQLQDWLMRYFVHDESRLMISSTSSKDVRIPARTGPTSTFMNKLFLQLLYVTLVFRLCLTWRTNFTATLYSLFQQCAHKVMPISLSLNTIQSPPFAPFDTAKTKELASQFIFRYLNSECIILRGQKII